VPPAGAFNRRRSACIIVVVVVWLLVSIGAISRGLKILWMSLWEALQNKVIDKKSYGGPSLRVRQSTDRGNRNRCFRSDALSNHALLNNALR
jgi:hypothetical protein